MGVTQSGNPGAGLPAIAGATVYRGASSSGPFTAIGTTAGSEFQDNGVSPSSTYWYQLTDYDVNGNVSAATSAVQVTTLGPTSFAPDVGGPMSYYSSWGAGPEHITLLTGALSLRLPLLKLQHRGNGPGFQLSASFNSQVWSTDAAGVLQNGMDVGYGYNFMFQIGALVPIYNGNLLVRYDFLDGVGSVHHMYAQSGSTTVFLSQDSSYLTLNVAASPYPTITFTDGTVWQFGCTSEAPEPDAGTMYPTQLEDTNGNLILRVGRYGNVDDGQQLAEGGPPHAHSIGGDEVSLFHACYVATHTDHRLFISDVGNGRLLSVRLDYHVNEIVPLKGARTSNE